MKLIEVSCYNCNSDDYAYFDSENGYNLVKCKKCGLLYVNPRPTLESISQALPTGVHNGEKPINFTGRYDEKKINKYLRVLKEFYPDWTSELSGKKWLDIGCGYGELLETLKIYSNDTVKAKGSEPNVAKAQFDRTKNLDVSFLNMETLTDKFDVISLLNVYSHIPDPVKYLDGLKKNLNPNGEIFLQTGHSAHIPAKHYFKPYQMPDHLSFANREIVENIFRKLGFEIVHTNIYRNEFFPFKFNFYRFCKEVVKVILRRRKNFRGLIPKYPRQDMFIRSRLLN